MRNRKGKKARQAKNANPSRAPKSQKPILGRVQKNPKGFAFIIPQTPNQPDAYVAREDARLLLNDDVVEYHLRRSGHKTRAEVLKIVKRGHDQLVGMVRRSGRDVYLETADGETYAIDANPAQVKQDQWVIAQIEEYPTRRNPAIVSVQETLGSELSPKQDNKIAIAQFGLEDQFPSAAIKEAEDAKHWAAEEMRQPHPKRKDLRQLPFITIDGEDAKDFDDAILVTPSEEKGSTYTLYVAIADVSFFVRPGTALDKSARRRGTSVYFPGFVIPMLPEGLSNDLCSLRPQTDKLALTAEIHLDKTGTVTGAKFYESIIKTARRLTYNQVHAFFEKDPATQKDLAFLSEPLTLALSLFEKMEKKRKERGVLDFQLPEAKIELDESAMPVGVTKATRYESHKLIEEFMIAANGVVAKALRQSNTLSLYRVHESPELTSIDDINLLMKSLGMSHQMKEVSPRAFATILAATMDAKGARTLHQNILRAQKQARYEPNPKGHFGLALSDYTHFTSPIRRYPDLAVHRALKQLISKGKSTDKDKELMDFEALGEQNSASERRAMEAERWVTRRKQCWFMEKHLGEIFDGVVAGITAKGLFVEIPEFATEGFVPIETLGGFYEYDEQRLCLKKRPGHTTISIGDPMKIQVTNVSVLDNEITFAPPEKQNGEADSKNDRPETSGRK